MIISDAGVELGDTRAEFGDFDSDIRETNMVMVKFIAEPFFNGGRFEVGKNVIFKLMKGEFGFSGLDEGVVGIESD